MIDRESTIRKYIVEELLEDDDVAIANEASMFNERLLDSLNLLALIDFLENEFQIKIESSEINLDNLDSINLILTFLSRKLDD